MIECESCGHLIGKGRLTCRNCGAASSIPRRVTDEWESNFDTKDLAKLEVLYHLFERLKFLSRPVANLIISNVTIELHFTDIEQFIKASFAHHRNFPFKIPIEKYWINKVRRYFPTYIDEVEDFYRIVCHHTESNKITLFEMSKSFLKVSLQLTTEWRTKLEKQEKECKEQELKEEQAKEEKEERLRQHNWNKRKALLEEALAEYDKLSWWEKRKTRRPIISDMEV